MLGYEGSASPNIFILPITFVSMPVPLRLSKDSYGNALGIGLADITVKKLADSIDYDAMYSNLGGLHNIPGEGEKLVRFETEKESVDVAFDNGAVLPENARVMVIDNTLHIETVLVSRLYMMKLNLLRAALN